MLNPPHVITFGCRLNAYESEVMRGHAVAAGLNDVVIVNTCAVTAEAERQAGQAIRRLRREKPSARIIVTGCAAHIDATKFAAMPEVDHVVPNDRKMEAAAFERLSRSGSGGIPLPSREGLGEGALNLDRAQISNLRPGGGPPHLTSPARGEGFGRSLRPEGEIQRAFVQVQNGCDHRCTFCIIPFGRGASRSVAVEDVVRQVRVQVALGYREVVFTGVDITSYGADLPGAPRLGTLIGHVLDQVPELPRLRLSSLDPAAIDEELWRLIGEEERLMPHLHLSVQAGDDLVLKRMKRRHLRADVIALCERARRLRPDIAFGADIITGFPTESETMFQNTFDLAEQCGITWLHVFPYSARKGTPAARMPQVNGVLRRERAERLRALGEAAAARHKAALAGRRFDVLVEQQGLGCTRQFAKLRLEGEAPVGEIVEVEGRQDADGRVVAKIYP